MRYLSQTTSLSKYTRQKSFSSTTTFKGFFLSKKEGHTAQQETQLPTTLTIECRRGYTHTRETHTNALSIGQCDPFRTQRVKLDSILALRLCCRLSLDCISWPVTYC